MGMFLGWQGGSVAVAAVLLGYAAADAEELTFFDASQGNTLVNSGTTSNTIASHGYVFTYTQDKLFTGGVGLITPIGRTNVVTWPDGLHAQAITAGPTPGKAYLTITREDGDTFDILAFTAKLLGNTAGAGAAFEVVPKLDGEEVLNDPVTFQASGYYGQNFTYTRTPTPFYNESTIPLSGYDSYRIGIYVDFGLMSLTVDGAPTVPEPAGLAALCAGAALLARRVRRH